MAVRTTVDIPQPLHDRLRKRSEQTGTSMRALIVRALELAYSAPEKSGGLTGPIITGKGKRGPRFPVDENPYGLFLP